MANNLSKNKRNVPPLRFPEFSGEWNLNVLNNVCTFHNGRAYKQHELLPAGKYRVLRVGNFFTNESWYYSDLELEEDKMASDGELLYAWSASFGPRFWKGDKVIYHYHIWKIDSFREVCKEYLFYFLEKDATSIRNEVQGGTMAHITKGDMERRSITYPTINEQSKIARLLSLLDERIATQNKIIEKYESLIQAIIYQSKTVGLSKGTWQKTTLSKILHERNEKNVEGKEICSVSVSQGIVNQIKYLGRSFAAKDTAHYNIVKYGDIVYTKSPTGDFPYGIVKRSCIKDGVAVSPLYGVYMPINNHIGVILHFYFMQPSNAFNYLHPLIQKGAKNTINITNGRFLENSIPLPQTEDEALCIANALKTIQRKIDIEKDLLQSYEKEKEYLLCQMFI